MSRCALLLASARIAAGAGRWGEAATASASALALWRGEPLEDVGSETLRLREVPRLAEMRLQALETRIEADMHMGRHAEVVTELRDLTAAEPLRENLHALLMLALYGCGRQAEALAAYRAARRRLIDEIGTEPGVELRELHKKILAADPQLTVPQPPARLGGASGKIAVPRELPGTPADFTGRERELATLTGLLDASGSHPPGTVVISTIGGTAGVGKTALAVY